MLIAASLSGFENPNTHLVNRLRDERSLITGGATGIGLETARQFLREGVRVAMTGRNPATLDAAHGICVSAAEPRGVASKRERR